MRRPAAGRDSASPHRSSKNLLSCRLRGFRRDVRMGLFVDRSYPTPNTRAGEATRAAGMNSTTTCRASNQHGLHFKMPNDLIYIRKQPDVEAGAWIRRLPNGDGRVPYVVLIHDAIISLPTASDRGVGGKRPAWNQFVFVERCMVRSVLASCLLIIKSGCGCS
ncbi:hypothetical protein BU16DRAFT_2510 [Lophium mytilinum]|uniref:Uncharacterized protein n=1 Tax=Lophium mytilinum TaxID=390894 RepID=A0A6A6RBS1_9PEZI|nr:hypothetical protein BU16DRAFT_2510 [Lophium mytilinum]